MAWPATSGSTTGYTAQGTTTIRWGSDGLLTSAAGSDASFAIVTRAHQRQLVDNVKLPNGSGVTTTRIQVKDGQTWDLTVRDDTRLVAPAVGAAVILADMGGLIAGYNSGAAYFYTGKVVESGYETGSKQAGERTITVESLLLVESQTGS